MSKFKTGDKVVLKKLSFYATHIDLSIQKEYIISKISDRGYMSDPNNPLNRIDIIWIEVTNDKGELVLFGAENFDMSPIYIRNNKIDDILS